MTRIAVLADPHLHDVRFGMPDAEPRFVRSLSDSLDSTRVFNESEAALRAALDAVAAEGIVLCIIVGDLTDDAQPANWQAVSNLLDEYSERFGMRFFAAPGNHDQWSMTGKPLAKNFVGPAGTVEECAGRTVSCRVGVRPCPGMRMVGYGEAMMHSGQFGYCPRPGDLHWETPFGSEPDPARRVARVTSGRGESARICDLSYLVEPVDGIWLLSLDANVYLPDGAGGYVDRAVDGWNATLRHKPYLLDWMRDVASRAKRLNKRLIAFSHYPVADVFHGCTPILETLPVSRAGTRRMPTPEVAARIADTGVSLHFSGHWHVDSTAAGPGGRLVNVAVPSTVAYPAGWKCLHIEADGVTVTDHRLCHAPGFDRWFGRYAAEVAQRGRDEPALHATDYRRFLDEHFRHVVLERRLTEDWPDRMQSLVDAGSLADRIERFGAPVRDLPAVPFAEVLVDWYRLREAGGGPAAAVSEDRRALYADLARTFGHRDVAPDTEAAILAVFFRTLGLLLTGEDRKAEALALL